MFVYQDACDGQQPTAVIRQTQVDRLSQVDILSAAAFYSLRSAIERGRQRRSMADMRALALAVNSYGVDFVQFPLLPAAEALELRPYLTPTYLKILPERDGWHRQFLYEGQGIDYTLLSVAMDGARDGDLPLGPTTHFNRDIVMHNGVFIQWPDGMQVK